MINATVFLVLTGADVSRAGEEALRIGEEGSRIGEEVALVGGAKTSNFMNRTHPPRR